MRLSTMTFALGTATVLAGPVLPDNSIHALARRQIWHTWIQDITNKVFGGSKPSPTRRAQQPGPPGPTSAADFCPRGDGWYPGGQTWRGCITSSQHCRECFAERYEIDKGSYPRAIHTHENKAKVE